MNEQALKDSYELFKQKGYTKSFDEYVELINTNPNALSDSYSIFKEAGYTKSPEEFSTLVGVKKKEESISMPQEDVMESTIQEAPEENISSDSLPQRNDSITDNDYLVGLSNGSIKTNEGTVATISEVFNAAKAQDYPQDEIDTLMINASSDPTSSASVVEESEPEIIVPEGEKPNWQKQIDELGDSASLWNDPSAEGVSMDEISAYYKASEEKKNPTVSTVPEIESGEAAVLNTENAEEVVTDTTIPTELEQQIYNGIYGRAIEQGDTSVPSIEDWMTNEGVSASSSGKATTEASIMATSGTLETAVTVAKHIENAYDDSFPGDLIRTLAIGKNKKLKLVQIGKQKEKVYSDEDLTEEQKAEKIKKLNTTELNIKEGKRDNVWASEPMMDITGYTEGDTNEFAVNVMTTLLEFAVTPSIGAGGMVAKTVSKVLPPKALIGIGKVSSDILVKAGLNPKIAQKIIKEQLPKFAKALDEGGSKFGLFDVAKNFQQQVDDLGGLDGVDFSQSPKAFAKGYGLGAGLGFIGAAGRQIPRLGAALKTEGKAVVAEKGITETLANRGLADSRILGTAGETIGLGGEALTFGLINATTPTDANPEGELTAESLKEGVGEAFKYIFAFRGVGLAKKIAAGKSVFNQQYSELNKSEKEKAWSLMTEVHKKIAKEEGYTKESVDKLRAKAAEVMSSKTLSEEAKELKVEKIKDEIDDVFFKGKLNKKKAEEYLRDKVFIKGISKEELKARIKNGESRESILGQEFVGNYPVTLVEKVIQELSGMKSNLTRDHLFNKVFEIKAQAKTDGTYEINTISKDGIWLGSLDVKGPAEVNEFIEAFKKEREIQITKTTEGKGNYPLSNEVNYSINPQPLLEAPVANEVITTVDGDNTDTTTNIVTEEYAAQKLIEDGVENATPEQITDKQQQLFKEQSDKLKKSTAKVEVTIEAPVDEYGDIDYEAEAKVAAIAKKRDLGITRDREIASIARDVDGNIIGGAYTSYDNSSGEYTFDVVVDEAFDGKGVGGKLLNEVIELPYEIEEMNPDAKVVVDVVNPQMQSMLEAKGFEVIEKTGPNRVTMSPKLEATTEELKPTEDGKQEIAKGNRLFSEPLQAATEIADRIKERTGIDSPKGERITKLDLDRSKRISDAYENQETNPNDPEVKEAYKAMIDETIEQYEDILTDGYGIEMSSKEYTSSTDMISDLRDNKNMRIFSTEDGFGSEGITEADRKANPMLAPTKFKDKNGKPLLVNDVFRFVHDFFGHSKEGNSFGPLGEENAWDVHSRMYSPKARRAVTTETRGQNSWVNFSGANDKAFKIRDEARALRKEGKFAEAEARVKEAYEVMKFADQKVMLLPEEFTFTDGEIASKAQLEVEAIKADKNIDLSGLDVFIPKVSKLEAIIENIEEDYAIQIENILEEISIEQANTKEGVAELKAKASVIRKDKTLSKEAKEDKLEDIKYEIEDFKDEQRDIITTYKEDLSSVKSELKSDIKEAKKSTPDFKLNSTAETKIDAAESARVTAEINEIESPNKDVQLGFKASTPISMANLNKRTDTPLKSVTLKVVDGLPTIFTITDQLTTGNTINPETGNVIDNLKGAIGFNGTEGHENFAWANLSPKEGEAIITKATKVYEDNKVVFEKWWKDNPEYNGLIPMNVVKMGEGAMISNEATFRVLADNISTLPAKNKKAALPVLKREIKLEIKKINDKIKGLKDKATKVRKNSALSEKAKSTEVGVIKKQIAKALKPLNLYKRIQTEISNAKATSIEQVLSSDVITKLSLSARVLLIKKIAYGEVGEPGSSTKNPSTPVKLVAKSLLKGLPEEFRRKINLGVITDAITDPELRNVPIGNVVSLVGVDVLNPEVLKTTHPNYKYGVKGKSIGILENPVPMEKAYPKTYEKSFKALIELENKGTKAYAGRLLSDQSGIGMGISSSDYVGAMTSSSPSDVNKLVSFLNLVFPDAILSVDAKAFNEIMNTEGVKKHLTGDEIVYGVTINGNMYINPDVHNSESALFNTAIHEMGHVWTNYLETTPKGREMYNKGVELVKETDTYKEQLEVFKGDEVKAARETIAILIGNKGETIIDGATKSKFKEWLLGLWNYIKKQLSKFKQFKDLTSTEIQNLNLDQFLGSALRDILGGKPIKLTPKQREAMNKSVAEFKKVNPAIEKVVKDLRGAGYSEVGIRELLKQKGIEVSAITESMTKVKKAPVKVKLTPEQKLEAKGYDPQPFIKEARAAGFTDERIVDYLVKRKGLKIKAAKKLIDINLDIFDKLPKSFGNISGGAKVGFKLFNRVQDFRDNLLAKNKELKKGKLSEDVIMDKTIEFLESQPEYKAEAETYVVKGETKIKRELSTIQAQMITEFQKLNILRPTQAMRAKLSVAKRDIKQRAKGIRDIKVIQNILKSFIRKTIPTDQYSKTDVVKLINKVIKADKASIDNLINEVFEFAISKNVKTLQGNINKALNIKTEEVQSGRLKGIKVDVDTAKLIKLINKNLLNKDSTVEEIEASLEAQGKELDVLFENPSENIEEIMARTALIGINNSLLMENTDPSKVDALDVALENLEALIGNGKSEFARLLEIRSKEYTRQAEEAYHDITGKKIDFSNPDAIKVLKEASRDIASKINKEAVEGKAKSWVKRILKLPENAFNNAEAIDGLMDKISSLPGELFGGKMQELVTDKIDASTIEHKRRRLIYDKVLTSKLSDIFGKDWKATVRKNRIQNVEITSIPDTYAAGNMFSQDEMYYLYNQFKDPANLNAFSASKIQNNSLVQMFGIETIDKSDSTSEVKRKTALNEANAKKVMAEIESKLDPKVKEWADWQVNEYFPNLYNHYNEVYKNIFGTDMPWNEFYSGKIYRDGVVPEALNLSADKTVNKTSIGGSSTKARVANSKPIKKMNGNDALFTYLKDMEFFAAYAENIRDIDKLFSNPNIKAAIISNHGQSLYNLILDRNKIIANQGTRSANESKIINVMNNVFTVVNVALKPVVYVKQLTSFVSYSAEIGLTNYIEHAARNKKDMSKVFREIKDNSTYMEDRRAQSILRSIESYSDSAVQEFIPTPTKDAYTNFILYLVKKGDSGAIYLGGMPLYSYYKAEFKKKNPKATDQEAIDFAILKFDKSTKRTQQSPDLQDKDTWQLGGPVLRGMSAFQTSQKQYLRKEIIAARNIGRKVKSGDSKAGKGTYWENIRNFAMFHSALPMFFQFVSAGFQGALSDWDEDDTFDMLRAALIGNLNSLFILGDVVDAVADYTQEKPWADEIGKNIGVVELSRSIMKKAVRADQLKDPDKKLNAQLELCAEALKVFKIPAPQVMQIGKSISAIANDDLDTGELIQRILVYSEYVIKKGKKDKKSSNRKNPTNAELEELYGPELMDELKELEESMKSNKLDYLDGL